MASQLMQSIPPSQDTLFMRGFSSRRKVEDIKEFFERESGEKCMVVFHRDDEAGERLYIALKFETREAARDILDRFDNQEVFNDLLIVTWFRDMRKARAAGFVPGGPKRYFGGGGGGWNNNYYGGRGGPGGFDGPPVKRRPPPPPPTRYYPQQQRRRRESSSRSRSGSSNRSRSHSRSSESRYRTDSRSVSPHRSRDRSADYYSSESSPERRSKDKKKKKKSKAKKSKKSSREPNSARSTHSKDEEDGRVSGDDDGNYDDAEQSNDYYDPIATETTNGSGEKQLRSSVQMIEKKANGTAVTPKSSGKEASAKLQQVSATAQGQGQAAAPVVNAMAMQEFGTEGLSNAGAAANTKHDGSSSQTKGSRKAPSDHFATLDEDLRSVKRVIKRTPVASNQRDSLESGAVQSRTRKDSELAAGGEFDTIESATKRRRLHDDDMYEGGNRRRDSGTQDRIGGYHGNGDGWDNVTTFDFLMEQGVGQQSKDDLIRDKKISIEKGFVQDCDTLTSVVKLLVSKDPDLESRLQFSLRETLKEIGQRCIQELREFVERTNKSNDDALPAAYRANPGSYL